MNTVANAVSAVLSSNTTAPAVSVDSTETDRQVIASAKPTIDRIVAIDANTVHGSEYAIGAGEAIAEARENAGSEKGLTAKEARAMGRNVARKLMRRDAKALVASDLSASLAALKLELARK